MKSIATTLLVIFGSFAAFTPTASADVESVLNVRRSSQRYSVSETGLSDRPDHVHSKSEDLLDQTSWKNAGMNRFGRGGTHPPHNVVFDPMKKPTKSAPKNSHTFHSRNMWSPGPS